MTLARRLTAIVLALATLHLAAGHAQAACDEHEAHPSHSGSPHERGDHDSPTLPASQHDCDAQPTQCCDAVASCSVVAAIASATPDRSFAPAHAPAVAFAVHALVSRSAAPEPPPPRA